MRILFAVLVSGAALLSFNSCKQCTTCVKYPAEDRKLCKKDYASADSYNDAFRQTVAEGYDCD